MTYTCPSSPSRASREGSRSILIYLSESDKAELASLLIETDNSEGYECLVASKYSDETINALIRALKTEKAATDAYLVETIKKNAIQYFDETMQLLFEEEMSTYISERNQWLDEVGRYGDPDDLYNQYRKDL